MAELKNARHELFAVLIAQGENSDAQCYVLAKYKAKNEKVAAACASRLLNNASVRGRVAELKAMWAKAAGIETTNVINWLAAIADFDIRKVMSWKTDKNGVPSFTLIDSDKIDDRTAMAIKGFRFGANGFEVILASEKTQPSRLIGEHFGMFQGETATSIAPVQNQDNSKHVTYIEAPRGETVEEWEARINKRLGRPAPALINGKLNGGGE